MRDHCLKVYVSDEDKSHIMQTAEETGLSVSRYLERCGTRRKITSKIDQQAIDNLIKINADLARLGNLMKFTMTELSDETDDEAAKNLIAEAHKTMTEAREVQEVLKAKIRELNP